MITRAGFMNGVALQQIDKILRKKMKNLSARFFIRMPSNYLLLPEFTPEQEQKDLFKNTKNSIENICDFIKNDKKTLKIKVINKRTRHFERINLNFHKSVNQNDKFFFFDENCDSYSYVKKFVL